MSDLGKTGYPFGKKKGSFCQSLSQDKFPMNYIDTNTNSNPQNPTTKNYYKKTWKKIFTESDGRCFL